LPQKGFEMCRKPGAKSVRVERFVSPQLAWIISYIEEEGFPKEHLEALCHIVGLFNECEESEKEIFDFAHYLRKKYQAKISEKERIMDTDELRKAANYIIFIAVDTTDKNMAQVISDKLNHAAHEIDRLRNAIISVLGASTLDEVKDILNKVI